MSLIQVAQSFTRRPARPRIRMGSLRWLFAAILVISFLLAGSPVARGSTQTLSSSATSYVDSTEVIANPERGFYRHGSDCDKKDFVAETLAGYRTNDHVGLVMCLFYLTEFKNQPISDAQLARLQRQADVVKTAGLKMILRFAYTSSSDGDDAPLSRIKNHLNQLAPFLRNKSNVIAVMQTGFIGAWGEGYYTQNFGNQGIVSPNDWANRKAVVDKILSVLPGTRMVQLRTPTMKRQMYGTAAATGVFNGSAIARVGHHNDCFLASTSDYGTYQDPAVEYPYLQADTQFVVMGGETCRLNSPRSDCPTALNEMAGFHYSYLNRTYRPEVIAQWSAAGCFNNIDRNLGYRLSLVNSTFPATVTSGGQLAAKLSIRNTGWSAPFNPRKSYLVLRNTVTGALHQLPFSSDPRRWAAGQTVQISQNLKVPTGLAPGKYDLLVSLPDPSPALAIRPEYAIQLATVGVWEPVSGFNNLRTSLTVQAP